MSAPSFLMRLRTATESLLRPWSPMKATLRPGAVVGAAAALVGATVAASRTSRATPAPNNRVVVWFMGALRGRLPTRAGRVDGFATSLMPARWTLGGLRWRGWPRVSIAGDEECPRGCRMVKGLSGDR